MTELEDARARGQKWLDATQELTPEPQLADRVIQLEVVKRLAVTVIHDLVEATEFLEEDERKPRSPWTWPLVALGVILVLTVSGTVMALLTS